MQRRFTIFQLNIRSVTWIVDDLLCIVIVRNKVEGRPGARQCEEIHVDLVFVGSRLTARLPNGFPQIDKWEDRTRCAGLLCQATPCIAARIVDVLSNERMSALALEVNAGEVVFRKFLVRRVTN